MKKKRLYIVRRFVIAEDMAEALKLEKKAPIHDVFLEENSYKEAVIDTINQIRKEGPMGF